MTLSNAMLAELAAYAIVFCRVGAAMMFMPGFGDQTVNVRVRLLIALLLALSMGSVYGASALLTGGFWTSVAAIGSELTIGLFLGLAGRICISALQTAGMMIAMQINMANAISFDAVSAQQGALPGNFLAMIGVVLLFVTDLHHLLLAGLAASYETFPPGAPLPIEGLLEAMAMLVSRGFAIALAMAAPFYLVGVVISTGMGLLARLMPQVQVFFIVMPLQIAVGLGLFALTLAAGMRWYMAQFTELQSLVFFGG